MLCIVLQLLMSVPVVLNEKSIGFKDGNHAMAHQKMKTDLAIEQP